MATHLSHVAKQTNTCGAEGNDCRYTGPFRFQVSNRPMCIRFWGLCGEDLSIWAIAGSCEEFRAEVCDMEFPLEEGCEYIFDKPGLYEVRMRDGSDEMPEDFFPEVTALSVSWTQMMKTGSCCS